MCVRTVLAVLASVLPCSAWGLLQPAEAAPGVSQEVAQIARQDLARLGERLNDSAAPQDVRDDAARRLISRQSPEARKIVADALVTLNPGGQLAAARALAEDPQPDPAMINPLFAVLGTNRPLTEAASRALTAYKGHPEVTQRLIDYVRNRTGSETTRLIVLRSIGAMPEKRAAEFLVSIIRDPQESIAARNAAAEALADLTGMPGVGPDVAHWSTWWERNSLKGEELFRADLLSRRSARYDRMERSYQQLSVALTATLIEQYRATAAAQRPDLLLKYLRSEEPQTRMVAATIISDEAQENRPPTPAVREQLRHLIGDSDAAVRAAVAEAFARINDALAFDALLAQLAQEPNPSVRASLAKAVAPIKDLRAVPVLIAMLSDPSLTAAGAAAQALRTMGPHLREVDPVLAQRTAVALRTALEQRTGTPETLAFREDLVDAMAPLRQEDLLPIFTRMLDQRRGESTEVRRLAIRAIGEIANPQSAGVLIPALEDSEPRIRLAAVQAMQNNPAMAENSPVMRDRLDPQREPDDQVRQAAWRALQTVFPLLPKQQLQDWADRFKQTPDRRLFVLKTLADQQLRDKEEDGLATTRETIGQVLMELGEFREAAEYYRLALEFKRTSPGVPGAAIENLMHSRMQALLRGRDYQAAVAFASQMIRENPGNSQLFGGLIWNEAQRLRDTGEHQAALELIAATAAMDPPLSERYREDLSSIEKEINAKKTQQNATTPPPALRSVSAPGLTPNRSAAGE